MTEDVVYLTALFGIFVSIMFVCIGYMIGKEAQIDDIAKQADNGDMIATRYGMIVVLSSGRYHDLYSAEKHMQRYRRRDEYKEKCVDD